MAPNARDFQIIRETVGAPTANARDFQIIRETIVVNAAANARDFMVMRELIISIPVPSKKQPVLFAVT